MMSGAFDNTDDGTMSLYSSSIMTEEHVTVDDLIARWPSGSGVAAIKALDLRALGYDVVHSPYGPSGLDHAHCVIPGSKHNKKRKKIRDAAAWIMLPPEKE